MQKKLLSLMGIFCLFVSLSSCASKDPQEQSIKREVLKSYDPNLSLIVSKMVLELIRDKKLPFYQLGPVAVTSFVDLHYLEKTTHFGQLISENFMSELYKQGLDVVDFRARKNIVMNSRGQFFITRNVKKVRIKPRSRYVFVGTYSLIDNSILLNARIIDNTNDELVASARAVYTKAAPKYLKEIAKEEEVKKKVFKPKMIRIISGASEEVKEKNKTKKASES